LEVLSHLARPTGRQISFFVGKISGIHKTRPEPNDSRDTVLLRFSVEQLYRELWYRKQASWKNYSTTGSDWIPGFEKGTRVCWSMAAVVPRQAGFTCRQDPAWNFEMSEDLAYFYDLSHGKVESSAIVQTFSISV